MVMFMGMVSYDVYHWYWRIEVNNALCRIVKIIIIIISVIAPRPLILFTIILY